MSGFIFPPSPTPGQTAVNPSNNATYLWDGAKWVAVPGGARVSVGATAPTNPRQGDMWFDTAAAQLKVWAGAVWVLSSAVVAMDDGEYV